MNTFTFLLQRLALFLCLLSLPAYGLFAQAIDSFYICDTQPWNTPALGCDFGHSLEDGVEWPGDILLNGCDFDLSPDALEDNPEVNPFDARPRVFLNPCLPVGVGFKDTELQIPGSACKVIVRKWTIVDWCQPDSLLPLKYVSWTYNQKISVLESMPPELDSALCQDITICMDPHECNFAVSDTFLRMSATDNCTPTADLRYFYKLDAFNDGGPLGGFDFDSDNPYNDGDDRNFPSPPNILDTLNHDDDPATPNIVEGKFPAGVHRLFWKVEDGCGNVSTCEYLFEVKDCKKPTPVCFSSLVTVIMPTSGEVSLSAELYNAGSFDDCTEENDLIYAFSDQIIFAPDGTPIYDTLRTFTCDDLGSQSLEIWVKDAPVGYDDEDVTDDNWDYCEVLVFLQDPNDACGTSNPLQLSGSLMTPAGQPVPDATVSIDAGGVNLAQALSSAEGQYSAPVLLGENYSITPQKDTHPLQGVTTLDLLLISQHILGTLPLDSPYKIIAADVNHDEKITMLDIVELQQFILGNREEYSNNQSWRFVDAAYLFPNPLNPFSPPFPEVIDLNNVSLDDLYQDFIGVKIGDVNESLTGLKGEATVQARGDSPVYLQTRDREFRAGEELQLDFRLSACEDVAGLQFALSFDARALEFLGLEPAAMERADFGLRGLEQGILRGSWLSEGPVREGMRLFTLRLRARRAGNLRELLRMHSAELRPEAYRRGRHGLQTHPLELRFEQEAASRTAALELHPITPNPFGLEGATLSFTLPAAGEVRLEVVDLLGRVQFSKTGEYQAGRHQFLLPASRLSGGGVYTCLLRFNGQLRSRQLVFAP